MKNDFNVKFTVRNARMLNLINKEYASVAAFCRENELQHSTTNSLVTMRASPLNYRQDWTPLAIKISGALNVLPAEIWPEHIQNMRIKKPSFEVEMSKADVVAIASPECRMIQKQLLKNWVRNLNPREIKAITYITEGGTFAELADEFGVTGARARDIQIKALQKMKQTAKVDGVHVISELME